MTDWDKTDRKMLDYLTTLLDLLQTVPRVHRRLTR